MGNFAKKINKKQNKLDWYDDYSNIMQKTLVTMAENSEEFSKKYNVKQNTLNASVALFMIYRDLAKIKKSNPQNLCNALLDASNKFGVDIDELDIAMNNALVFAKEKDPRFDSYLKRVGMF